MCDHLVMPCVHLSMPNVPKELDTEISFWLPQALVTMLESVPSDDSNGIKWACAAISFFLEHNEEGQRAMLIAGILPVRHAS